MAFTISIYTKALSSFKKVGGTKNGSDDQKAARKLVGFKSKPFTSKTWLIRSDLKQQQAPHAACRSLLEVGEPSANI